MLLSTANIKANPLMRQARVRRDVKTTKSRSTIVGWQEIKLRRYKRAVKDIYASAWQSCQLDTPIPISVKRDHFTILKSGQVRTHKGRAGASPRRYFTWALVRAHELDQTFMVLNTHYVSGAWNHKRKLFKGWRKRMWEKHHAELCAFVCSVYESGLSIVGTGDFNRVHVSRFHPDQVWCRDGGIDKLWYLEAPGGLQFTKKGETRVTNLESDHHLRTTHLTLR